MVALCQILVIHIYDMIWSDILYMEIPCQWYLGRFDWIWPDITSMIGMLSLRCHIVAGCLFILFLAVWPGLCLLLSSPCLLIISDDFLMQTTSPGDGKRGRGSRRQQLHISFTILTMLLNTFHSTMRYMGETVVKFSVFCIISFYENELWNGNIKYATKSITI